MKLRMTLPMRVCEDAARQIEFSEAAFGADEPGGRIIDLAHPVWTVSARIAG